jgi:hypothetical protein
MAVRLLGTLDADALSRALSEVLRRHEALRTTFAAVDGAPLQRISPARHLPLELEPLDGAAEPALLRRLRDLGRIPFDLAAGPLLRARLLRLGPGEHVLSLTMHHVASDGWSAGVLVREATALYDAFRRGQPSPLPEPAIQYADFAAWQRDRLSGDVLRSQLDYWRGQLAGLEPTPIPADHPRPDRPTDAAGEARARVDPATLEALGRLSREAAATLYMTLLAAFQLLLGRYSARDDVAVGTPVAGRSRPEAEGLIGLFVNTLVLRADLSGDPTFRGLLDRTRRAALDAYAHQDLPFDRLVAELHGDPFRVMLALQNAPMPPLQADGLRLVPMAVPAEAAKFDATLFAVEADGGLDLTLEYRAELFEPPTMARLLACYVTLLREVASDPDRTIGRIPMITPEERASMAGQWRGPDGDGPDETLGLDLEGLDEDDLDALLAELDGGGDVEEVPHDTNRPGPGRGDSP